MQAGNGVCTCNLGKIVGLDFIIRGCFDFGGSDFGPFGPKLKGRYP